MSYRGVWWLVPALALLHSFALPPGNEPSSALLEVLDERPYVVPASSFDDGLIPGRLGRVLLERDGEVSLETWTDGGAVARSSATEWLERHATRAAELWLVGHDPVTGRVVYWNPVDDPATIRGEYTGVALPAGAGSDFVLLPADTGVVYSLHSRTGPKTFRPSSQPVRKSKKLPKAKSKVHCVRLATAAKPLDILFVASRFKGSTELDHYRKAVECITSKVLSEEPFLSLSNRINVWRVDVESTSEVALNPGQSNFALPTSYPPSLGASTLPDVLPQDLPITPLAPGSQAVWFNDKAKDLDPIVAGAVGLIRRTPRLVLVLLNSTDPLGGGLLKGGAAISSLHDIDNIGWRLASHELGHAFGLYDETKNCHWQLNYTKGGPNIASESEVLKNTVAWKTQCSGGTCEKTWKSGTCAVESSLPKASSLAELELWLGGNCSCETYTPSGQCRMYGWAADHFCSICAGHLGTALETIKFKKTTISKKNALLVDLSGGGLHLSGPGGLIAPTPAALQALGLDAGQEWLAEVEIAGTVDVGEVAIRRFEFTVSTPEAGALFRVAGTLGPGDGAVPVHVSVSPPGETGGPLVEDAVAHETWTPRRLLIPLMEDM